MYFELKEYDEAINCFQEIIDRGDGWDCNYYMGIALKHKKEYTKALEYLNKIEDSPYHREEFLNAQKAIDEIKNEID